MIWLEMILADDKSSLVWDNWDWLEKSPSYSSFGEEIIRISVEIKDHQERGRGWTCGRLSFEFMKNRLSIHSAILGKLRRVETEIIDPEEKKKTRWEGGRESDQFCSHRVHESPIDRIDQYLFWNRLPFLPFPLFFLPVHQWNCLLATNDNEAEDIPFSEGTTEVKEVVY